jgi:hypothetical protein
MVKREEFLILSLTGKDNDRAAESPPRSNEEVEVSETLQESSMAR